MVVGLESVLRDADLDLVLYHVAEKYDRSRFFEQLPARREVDAVVVVAFPVDDRERERLALLGVHVVAAGGQSGDYPYVSIDDLAAGTQAVNHLLNLGHRRIAMLEALDPSQPPVTARSWAYYQCLEQAGVAVDPELVRSSDWGGEQGAASMAALARPALAAHRRYAALRPGRAGVLAHVAAGWLARPRRRCRSSASTTIRSPLYTHLTTVRQPVELQGRLTAELLLALLRGDDVDLAVDVATELVVACGQHSSAGRVTWRSRPPVIRMAGRNVSRLVGVTVVYQVPASGFESRRPFSANSLVSAAVRCVPTGWIGRLLTEFDVSSFTALCAHTRVHSRRSPAVRS